METRHFAAYAVGHLCNDLIAAMWFFYISWYLNKVVLLDKTTTAACGLSGQLADGFTTPIVGILSDKTKTRCGKRMPWYYFGALMTVPVYIGIYGYPMFINEQDEDGNFDDAKRRAWYITLPALVNVGWACA